MVPISSRALDWIAKWIYDIRPDFISDDTDQTLFISSRGRRMLPNYVSNRVRDRWMKAEGIEVLRFTCFQVENKLPQLLNEIDRVLTKILSAS